MHAVISHTRYEYAEVLQGVLRDPAHDMRMGGLI